MGSFYKYTCKECGHSETYRTGFGFATISDYADETEEREAELRKEIEEGRHGSFLRKVLGIEDDVRLACSCATVLCQCSVCKTIKELPTRSVVIEGARTMELDYHFLVDFYIDCSECGGPAHRIGANSC